MPRINIEDSIYRDTRYQDYLIKCGNRREALGGWAEVIIAAQKYFLSHGEIPIEKFYALGLDERLIETGLAKKTDTGVIIIGQAEHFEWLKKRSVAGHKGGVASVEAREAKYGTAHPNPEAMLEIPEASSTKQKQTEASSSFSISISKRKNKDMSSGDDPSWNQLLEIWNQNRGNLPECRGFNKGRRRMAQLSWREHPDRDGWVTVAQKLSASAFCNGGNDRQWRAGFDYFIRPGIFLKVMEGFYDKGPQQGSGIVFKKRQKHESTET